MPIMEATEFTAIIKNGIIEIPEQYHGQFEDKTVRIIVLFDPSQKVSRKKRRKITSLQVDTKNLFDRDEANER